MLCSKTVCFYGAPLHSVMGNVYLFDLERKSGLVYVRCVRPGKGGIVFPC